MIEIKENQKILSFLNYVDLFSGIGGFRLALDSFDANCVFSSEWDANAQDVYFDNFGERPHGDITKIDEKLIPDHDLLCGGFPCQAFSVSGKQKGFEDTRGTLFFDIARIADFHRPKIIILENVKNIINHDGGRTLSIIRNVLERLDYNIFIELLRGSDFGIPQHRDRVFFICIQKSINVQTFKLSSPNFNLYSVKDILEKEPDLSKVLIDRDKIVIQKELESDMLGNFPNRPMRIGTIRKGGQGDRVYSIEGTGITLSAYGGGTASKTGAYLVDGLVRKLTVRECARMMGFPDSFKISSNTSQAYTQFGNAVIINIVQFIILDLIRKKIL